MIERNLDLNESYYFCPIVAAGPVEGRESVVDQKNNYRDVY